MRLTAAFVPDAALDQVARRRIVRALNDVEESAMQDATDGAGTALPIASPHLSSLHEAATVAGQRVRKHVSGRHRVRTIEVLCRRVDEACSFTHMTTPRL
jgi:hypothetical protein